MNVEHTSGPWEVRPSGEIHKKGEQYYIAKVGVGISAKNTQANENLIVAAPDMIAALENCLTTLNIARDTIQPITVAQLKLHNLDPQTASKLDNTAAIVIAAIRKAKGMKDD